MKKILVVDDEEQNRSYLETLFQAQGFHVTIAPNGEQALEAARKNPPHIIISDILMPVMDGFMLCKEWKNDSRLKKIPFVFYTATYTEPKDEKLALDMGADLFVIKPQEPDILLDLIQKVMAKRKSEKREMTPEMEISAEVVLKEYSEVLFRKLEKKLHQLETSNQQLRILEEKYRLSFEHVMDVIYTIDTDFNVLTMSPSVERILGYKPQDLIGRPVSDLGNILTPESFEQAIADISFILKGKTIPATIYRFIAKDGTIKYGEVSGSPLMRENKIIGIISVARDITDRKLAEEALKESEKKYRELYDFLPIPVYEMDLEANITSANRTIYETFVGTEEDLKKGFKIWRILSPEEIEKSSKNIQRLLKGEQIAGTEYTLMRLDGSVFPAIVISSVIYSNGKPVGLRGAIIDITQRKRAEEELQRTLERLWKAFGATIQVMVSAVEVRDPYTAGHQHRSADLARAIATEMGLPEEKIEGIRMAGSIHDIGKLSIPAEILSKPTSLTELEFSLIKEHSQKGYEILKDVESPWPLAQIVYQHHERMDGSGYPRNLKGDDILIEARILAVADVIEAIASHRPYRPAHEIDRALEEIEKNKGITYDEDVVNACLRLFKNKGYKLA